MKDIIETVVGIVGLIITAIATGYGYSQYKEKKNSKQTQDAVQDALNIKEIEDLKKIVNKLAEDLEEAKERIISPELMTEIIDALKRIRDIQIHLGQLEIKCNLIHKKD